ncbi:MAG: transposase [Victivallales bacterium]|nr:transposase [Victivallales bacterium]
MTVQLFFLQILHGNTACTHLAGMVFTAAAYCKSRMRVKLEVLQSLLSRSVLQSHFGQPGGQRKGCGFPVAHVLAMTHAGTGMITKILAAPLRTHDMAKAVEVHPELRKNDLLVADRGFCSYAHLALFLMQSVTRLRSWPSSTVNAGKSKPISVI